MKHKPLINRLAFALASVLLCTDLSSCSNPKDKPYEIVYKSVLTENPSFARFSYNINGWNYCEFIDSSSRYNVGDDVRMYSIKK